MSVFFYFLLPPFQSLLARHCMGKSGMLSISPLSSLFFTKTVPTEYFYSLLYYECDVLGGMLCTSFRIGSFHLLSEVLLDAL